MKSSILAIAVILVAFAIGCSTVGNNARSGDKIEVVSTELATRIRVPGSDGEVMLSGEGGDLSATMADKEGRILMGAILTKDNLPYLSLGNDTGERKTGIVLLRIDEYGEPALAMHGKEKKGWITAGMSQFQLPRLTLLSGDAKHGPRAQLEVVQVENKHSPQLKLESGNRKSSVVAGFAEGVNPVLEMTDSKGRVRVRIGVGADDKPFIEMLDEDGKPTAVR